MRISWLVAGSMGALAACAGPTTEVATIEPLPATPTSAAPAAPLAPIEPRLEGTYVIDVDETSKMVDPELEKLPEDQREASRKMMTELLRGMKIELVLEPGGTARVRGSASAASPAEEKEEQGTWTRDGGDVVITSSKKENRPLRCTRGRGRLTCMELVGTSTFVFVRKP